MGHMLRKQIDKLNAEINMRMANIDRSEIPGFDNAVESTVETWPEQEAEDVSVGFETDLSTENLF
jgi:hypothetical protein